MKPINVLSLFDGMSCGRIALERASIPVNQYYASEIDKHAIKVSQSNWLDIEQIGDVTKVKACNLQGIDLLLGGSPCQGFSFSGNQLNFNDARSVLFFEYIRLLKSTKPKYFILENVSMKQEYQDIISGYLDVPPITINSSLVSAQNRKRLYWTNIPNIVPPTDNQITLESICGTIMEYGFIPEDSIKEVFKVIKVKVHVLQHQVGNIILCLHYQTGVNGNSHQKKLSNFRLYLLDIQVQYRILNGTRC